MKLKDPDKLSKALLVLGGAAAGFIAVALFNRQNG